MLQQIAFAITVITASYFIRKRVLAIKANIDKGMKECRDKFFEHFLLSEGNHYHVGESFPDVVVQGVLLSQVNIGFNIKNPFPNVIDRETESDNKGYLLYHKWAYTT